MTIVLDVVDRWQHPIDVDVVIRRETVELHCHGRLIGCTGRDKLRQWLRTPSGVLSYDDCAWFDLGDEGIALHIDELVPAFPLRDHIVSSLRSRI
jgi:hypothetical protein